MDPSSVRELLILCCAAILVLVARKHIHELAQMVAAGIDNFKNGGRGGPPTHPIPAADSTILNRRTRKAASTLSSYSSRSATNGSKRDARRAGR